MTYATKHWTGPAGNINHVLLEACAMMGTLKIPTDRIEALRAAVRGAESYDQAVAHIEAWFPVHRE